MRLNLFEKEWKDANFVLKALMQDQSVIDPKNEMVNRSIPVYSLVKNFKDGDSIQEQIMKTGHLTLTNINGKTNTKRKSYVCFQQSFFLVRS